MIVVDTNVIGYLFLDSPRFKQVEKVVAADSQWAAPLLWRSEFRNVLAVYIRKEILSVAEAVSIMTEAVVLLKGNEYEVSSKQVLRLVTESTCSAYDCEFVALARSLGVPLVTVDAKILKEFPTVAFAPEEYIKRT